MGEERGREYRSTDSEEGFGGGGGGGGGRSEIHLYAPVHVCVHAMGHKFLAIDL